MKYYFKLIAVIVIVISGIILAQKTAIPFALRWEKINQLAEKQLTESALKEVEEILVQAQKDKNSVELIKALIYKMRFTMEQNPDKAPELISEFEAFTKKSTDPADRALLYSMTAELYAKYYQNNSRNINNRTVVAGFVPEDIKEWTKNIYFDKISKLLELSMQNAEILQQTDALKFAALLEKGDDSRTLQPTLFDFLAYRKIDILAEMAGATNLINPLATEIYFSPASEFVAIKQDSLYLKSIENQTIETFRQLLNFHLKGKNTEALIYTDLNRLQYLQSKTNNDELYLKALSALEEKFTKNEFVVEIISEKADYYLQKSKESAENKAFKKTAYDICQDGIKRFPNYKRIDLLKNIQAIITQKILNVRHNEVLKPDRDLAVNINSTNIAALQINIYRINATSLEYFTFKQNSQNRYQTFPKRTLLETREIKLKQDPNFGETDTTLIIKSKEYGIYELSITPKGNTDKEKVSNTVFIVSDFGFIQRVNVAKLQNMYVLDRQTGLQQAGVQVRVYEPKWTGNGYKYELKNKSKSDSDGLCKIPFNTNYYETKVFFERGKDAYFSSVSYANFYNSTPTFSETPQLNIFTDRSLYRPGQTVYFKGIAYIVSKKKHEVVKNASYEVLLIDANDQKVSSKTFKTNEFGSFAGEFVLPDGGLNGAYRLQSGNFSQVIYVEEYKRPTFEVKIEKPKAEIRFGEKVKLAGNVKAYAGYNIGDAKVKYRVIRSTHRFCWWWNEPEKEISNGTATTDANGNFDVSFVPEKAINQVDNWRGNFYTYRVSADVTDPKGETQQGEQSISVGDKSLFIVATVPDKIEKNEETKLAVYTETLNGEKVNSVIDYEIYQLEIGIDFIENDKVKTDAIIKEKVQAGKFNTTDKNLMLNLKKLKSAQYKLILKTKDAWGNEVKSEHVFIVYDLKDKKPPVKTYKWLLVEDKEYFPGEKALIRFGTSTLNTPVLYELMLGNKVLETKWITFNNEIKSFEIPFKDEYGSGVTVAFTFMKEEKFFTEQIRLRRKIMEKKLTPKLSVFRDKLLPGEKAEWTITIPEITDSAKSAELLAGMYDASLDVIRPHSWSFNPVYRDWFYASPSWNCTINYAKSAGYAQFSSPFTEVSELSLDRLNWFGLEFGGRYYGGPIRIRGAKSRTGNDMVMSEMAVSSVSDAMQGKMAGIAVSNEESKDNIVFQVVEKIKEAKPKPVQIRTNFNETAFFYPQLRTDAKGNVKFSFTAPESLTRWNVKMLAHTADLYFGQGEAQVVTQKDLMVQMNLPRFVRRSDKLVLSANVINLTDKELKADVVFELIDPATEKPIILKDNKPKTITLAANQTKAVEWEISEFLPYELVTCKVIATAGNFSDGEQKYLPVLPDKVLITESLPLIIRGNQTRTFKFESLLKNGAKVETQNLAVEFSSNPAWYAVQALPTLSAPENENALDYFTAYYANSLAAFIANSNPKIAKIFDQWKNAKGSREALLSNLQKNTELKNMLLEETPWVMAAKDETEQKRQIALLFDLNMQKNQSQQYLDKLMKLQMPNGGFAWFEGMPESRYITQEIVLNLARLKRITGAVNYQLSTVNSALTYLDLEISRDFAELKKYNKNYQKVNCVGNMQLFYLHTRSEYPEIPVLESAREAVKFYTAQSEKYWTSFTLYGKAMMAVVANRNGKTQIANEILKSLKENALKTDEFGMYWAKNKSGYFWNERPIAVQAAIIEAFTEISKNAADVDEMKIWLLKQKQTQRWDSPIASVNAIYALLLQGSDWLANEGSVKIKIGTKTLEPANVEAGTGYFKQTIPVVDVRPAMGKVTVTSIGIATSSRTSNITSIGSATSSRTPINTSIGWGAMYWQYYQDQDKVQGQGGALKVTKKLFVKQGTTMIPIEQVQLKNGDKIVTRLVITTDRNLEFVALKDLRASCFEPVNQRSGCEWKEGVCYYQTTKDASTQFFFSYLPKGTYVFEYELWANNSGTFTSGITSIQCQYAPEFVSHT
ncbi:MAG: alpha-2-macroglobulin family protein, partial [Paludibacter sp.]|nr:alpha-2-macroglobulin family protein [Paludibacter sp.]